MSRAIQNLHSLLSGYWSVNQQQTNELLPYLNKILSGDTSIQENKPTPFIYASYDDEDWSEDKPEDEQKVVAILPIKGGIFKYNQMCGPRGTQTMANTIKKWDQDKSIVGILLDIDSGGGQVSGTAEFAEIIKNCKTPIAVYSDGMICSAAYHIASAANEIYMNAHSDMVGSIGTMFSTLNLDGYYKKLGAKVIEEYASKSTKKNHEWREVKKGNSKPIIEQVLDPLNDKFHETVKNNRPEIKEKVLDGRTVQPEHAQALGLIDGLKTKQEVINRLFELHKEKEDQGKSQNHNTEMAKTNDFPLLAAALGAESITTSNGILGGRPTASFTMEDLKVIEKSLQASNDTKAMEDLKTQLQAEKDEKATIQMQLDGLANGIDKAVKTTGAKGTTPLNQLEAVNSIITEWADKPGATHTAPETDGDREEVEESYIDPNAGHNKLVEQLKEIKGDE